MTNTYLFAGASSLMAVKTAALLKQQGHRVIGISTKMEIDGYDAFYTVEKYGPADFPTIDEPIDGLVYFPGTINLKPFHRFSEADFKTDFDVNVLGGVNLIQAFLPVLKRSEQAAIVLISSVAAQTGMAFHASISMAKGAIEALTRSLAAELAPGIRVNAVAPSLTDTPLAKRFIDTPEKLEASKQRNPSKMVGDAAQLAEAIAFLLTSQSSWITGQVIAVDGGMGALK